MTNPLHLEQATCMYLTANQFSETSYPVIFIAPARKKKVESDNDWDEEESEEEVKPKGKGRGRPSKIEKPKRLEQIQYINTDNMCVNMFINIHVDKLNFFLHL